MERVECIALFGNRQAIIATHVYFGWNDEPNKGPKLTGPGPPSIITVSASVLLVAVLTLWWYLLLFRFSFLYYLSPEFCHFNESHCWIKDGSRFFYPFLWWGIIHYLPCGMSKCCSLGCPARMEGHKPGSTAAHFIVSSTELLIQGVPA